MNGVDALVLNHVWGVVKFFEDIAFDDLENAFLQTYCMFLAFMFNTLTFQIQTCLAACG
jgi:hypothetical protein